MKLARVGLALLLCGGVACNGDDEGPMGPTLADLVGTWEANSTLDGTQLLVTPDLDPDNPVELVAVGAVVELVVESSGSFTFTVTLPGQPDIVITGTFELDGNDITVINDDDPDDPLTGSFDLSEDGNTLSITVNEAELIDLTMDGMVNELDSATLQLIMELLDGS